MAAVMLTLFSGCSDGPNRVMDQANALIAAKDMDAAHRLLRAQAQRLAQQGSMAQPETAAALITLLTTLAQLNAGPLHNPTQAILDNGKIVQLGMDLKDLPPDSVIKNQAILAQCRMADLYRDRLMEPEHAVSHLKAAALALGTRTAGSEVRHNLVATLMAMGNYAAAHSEAEAIIERWPNSHASSRARLVMGQADFMDGRFDRAIATLEALMDDSKDVRVRALAQVEAGNCHLEQNATDRALELYYAALSGHPNPGMVQDKILRARQRIHHIAPKGGILNASRPSRHIAAWQPRPTPQDLGVGAPITDVADRR